MYYSYLLRFGFVFKDTEIADILFMLMSLMLFAVAWCYMKFYSNDMSLIWELSVGLTVRFVVFGKISQLCILSYILTLCCYKIIDCCRFLMFVYLLWNMIISEAYYIFRSQYIRRYVCYFYDCDDVENYCVDV